MAKSSAGPSPGFYVIGLIQNTAISCETPLSKTLNHDWLWVFRSREAACSSGEMPTFVSRREERSFNYPVFVLWLRRIEMLWKNTQSISIQEVLYTLCCHSKRKKNIQSIPLGHSSTNMHRVYVFINCYNSDYGDSGITIRKQQCVCVEVKSKSLNSFSNGGLKQWLFQGHKLGFVMYE